VGRDTVATSADVRAYSTTIGTRRFGAGEWKRHKGVTMSTVETVNGPVDSADLGRTYVHEHVFVLTTEVQQNYPDEWGDEETRQLDAVVKLTALADSGVRTIVDPTVIGLGRYIPRIQQVAARVPNLNIVVATGCYTYRDVPFFFHHRTSQLRSALGMDQPEPMVDMFVGDITEGIAGTGVRAGMLKCAIDTHGLTPGVERVMRAVAKTHLVTGCPITVHTHPQTRQGLEVQRVMGEEGVDPRRVVLGHSGDSADLDHLSALADAGFWLGMDRFGINFEVTFEPGRWSCRTTPPATSTGWNPARSRRCHSGTTCTSRWRYCPTCATTV